MLSAFEETGIAKTVLEQIAELIRGGTYTPGQRLPSERQLAARLGVSRASIREAIRRLETVGLLVSHQGRGTFVRHPSANLIQASLAPYIFAGPHQLDKLFEIREMIEVEAAARAAERRTPPRVTRMRRWMEAMERHLAREDMESVTIADVEFHREIIRATDNEILVSLMDSIIDLLREMRRISPTIPELQPKVVAAHRAILAGIEAGSPAAARQAMQDHLHTIRDHVQQYWREQEAQAGALAGATPATTDDH